MGRGRGKGDINDLKDLAATIYHKVFFQMSKKIKKIGLGYNPNVVSYITTLMGFPARPEHQGSCAIPNY